jgi:hypothetical protein
MRSVLAVMPSAQCSRKLRHTSAEQADRVEHVVDDERLEHVELEVAAGGADADGDVVAEDLAADHRHGLALGRVDLAGHDRAAGLVLGDAELAEAAARAGGQPAHVVGDLHQRAGEGLERAVEPTRASWPASAANLLGAVTKGRPVSVAMCRALTTA